jgi:pimeloyl-ACP methyl ester carboxylesterase
MPEKYVRQAGIPILVRHTGPSTLPEIPPVGADRRAVVCLHDAGLQSSIFSDLLGALRSLRPKGGGDDDRAPRGPDACALAFDLPGHGRSGGLDALPSIEAMSECARGVTGWCRATRPILVGHGMGALVALDWARRAPESIAGLVLCGTSASFSVGDEAIALMREVTLGRAARPFDPKRLAPGGSPDLMRRAWFESIQTDPRVTLVDLEASRSFARALASAAKSPPATARAVPTLVACGEHEPAAELEAARVLATQLGARFTEIPSAAHWLPLEQPAALAREILALAEAA